MSTFGGRIKEYPAIAIDNFAPNNYAKYFVLSHVHKDHTRGLERADFRHKLYCSELTAKLLPLMETRASKQLMYSHLKDYVIGVKYDTPIAIETEEYNTINITFLPANHCIGSSLILIEGERGAVLYTGDMRADPHFVKNYLKELKNFRIKNLYMDTTCCYEDRRSFIPKTVACDLLVKLIKSYPDHHHIYLDCWTVGYEPMWIAISEEFRKKVHVSQQRYNMFCSTEPEFAACLTTDASSTRFHSCRWDEGCCKHEHSMISVHPTPNRNTQPYEYIKSKQKKLLATDLPYNCKPYLQMILPFSTHSSLEEIVFFYKYVNPREFTPCVVRGSWDQLSRMKRLLTQEGCRANSISTSSEIERANHTSSSSSSDGATSLGRTMGSHQSSVRSSINYVTSVEGSAHGSKTLTWPFSFSHSASSADHSNSAHIRPSSLPAISETSDKNLLARRSSSSLIRMDRRNSNNISNLHVQLSPLNELPENHANTEARQSPPSTDRITRSKSREEFLKRSSSTLVALTQSHSNSIPHRRRSSSCHHPSSIPINNSITKRGNSSSLTRLIRLTRNNSSKKSPSFNNNTSTSQDAGPSTHNHLPQRNVIVLSLTPSMTDSVCSVVDEDKYRFSILHSPSVHSSLEEEYSIHNSLAGEHEKENCQESDDRVGQGFCITPEKTRNFLKAIKNVQKRRQIKDKKFGTKNKPICL